MLGVKAPREYEPPEDLEPWTAGTEAAGQVTIYDWRFTNLRRRVNKDSTAAKRFPSESPLPYDVSPEEVASLFPEGQPGVEE